MVSRKPEAVEHITGLCRIMSEQQATEYCNGLGYPQAPVGLIPLDELMGNVQKALTDKGCVLTSQPKVNETFLLGHVTALLGEQPLKRPEPVIQINLFVLDRRYSSVEVIQDGLKFVVSLLARVEAVCNLPQNSVDPGSWQRRLRFALYLIHVFPSSSFSTIQPME
jgi:hypothetical protein